MCFRFLKGDHLAAVAEIGEERDGQGTDDGGRTHSGNRLDDVNAVEHCFGLRIRRQAIGFMTVSADVNHVQAAAFIFTIDLRLREALLLEELHTFVSLLEHLFTRPEAQRFRLAGLDAGRNAAVVETINAERALVDTAVHRAETRHVERAGRLTERAAVALIGVELHYAALILAERAGRAGFHAARIRAVVAGTPTNGPVHRMELVARRLLIKSHDETGVAVEIQRALIGTVEVLLIGVEFKTCRQHIPLLARHLAAAAASAVRGVEQHSDFFVISHLFVSWIYGRRCFRQPSQC